MSATAKSYAQNFLKVQRIIIQAILSRKSMKNFVVIGEKSVRLTHRYHNRTGIFQMDY